METKETSITSVREPWEHLPFQWESLSRSSCSHCGFHSTYTEGLWRHPGYALVYRINWLRKLLVKAELPFISLEGISIKFIVIEPSYIESANSRRLSFVHALIYENFVVESISFLSAPLALTFGLKASSETIQISLLEEQEGDDAPYDPTSAIGAYKRHHLKQSSQRLNIGLQSF